VINLDLIGSNADWLRRDLAAAGITDVITLDAYLHLHEMSLDHFLTLPLARRNAVELRQILTVNATPAMGADGMPLTKGIGVWRTILHPRDRFGRFRESSIGITPFREGQDKPRGFYNSQKFGDFIHDVHEFAGQEGIRVIGDDPRVGLWEGGKEPAVDLRIVARSPRAARRYAARLGKKYDQDAVATFRMNPKGKQALYTVKGRFSQGQVWKAAQEAGIEFGRFTPGRFELIGDEHDLAKINTLSKAVGGNVSFVAGDAEFIERSQYDDATRKAASGGSDRESADPRGRRDGGDARLPEDREREAKQREAGEAGRGGLMEIVAQSDQRYVIAVDDEHGFILDLSGDTPKVTDFMSPEEVEPMAEWWEPTLGDEEAAEILSRAKLHGPRKPWRPQSVAKPPLTTERSE
jgi:hypothetical protein